MSKVLHNDDDNNDTKAIAIPQVFSEDSQAKNKCILVINATYQHLFSNCTRFDQIIHKYKLAVCLSVLESKSNKIPRVWVQTNHPANRTHCKFSGFMRMLVKL